MNERLADIAHSMKIVALLLLGGVVSLLWYLITVWLPIIFVLLSIRWLWVNV